MKFSDREYCYLNLSDLSPEFPCDNSYARPMPRPTFIDLLSGYSSLDGVEALESFGDRHAGPKPFEVTELSKRANSSIQARV